jgi:hypothetical protein
MKMTLYLTDILPKLRGQVFGSQQNEWITLNDATPPALTYAPLLPGRDEAVKYDGTALVRGVDYTINYLTGVVTRVLTSTVVADGDQCAFTYSYDALETAFYEAVKDFSRRAPRIKTAEIAIVAGTVTYDLPADYVFKIEASIEGDWLVALPFNPFNSTQWGVQDITFDNGNRTVTFPEQPFAPATLYLTYAAGYPILTDDLLNQYFDGLNDEYFQIILYKAWAIACANPGASFGRSGPPVGAITEYTAKIGNEQATKKWDGSLNPAKMSMTFNQMYEAAVKALVNQPTAVRDRARVAPDTYDIPSTLLRNW